MKKLLTVLLLAALTLLPLAAAQAQEPETAYARVMRTKVLRCGYLPYEPFVSKDINSGELSGLTVDYVNAVAAKLGLTVEWAAEVNIDQVVPALNGGRIDAFCLPCTPEANWEKMVGFNGDLGALSYYTYVRADSTLTPEQLETARIAVVDGYALSEIAKRSFPHADFFSLPQSTSTAEMYDQLRFSKATAHVNEDISASNYMKNNPGVIRRFSDVPLIAVRMFLITPKSDAEMGRYIENNFSAVPADNLALMKELMVKYNVPAGALLLADACTPTVLENGAKICTPATLPVP